MDLCLDPQGIDPQGLLTENMFSKKITCYIAKSSRSVILDILAILDNWTFELGLNRDRKKCSLFFLALQGKIQGKKDCKSFLGDNF